MKGPLRPIEKRVLAYLDQHGPTDRQKVVTDLANPESNAARYTNGSNGAKTLIMGRWCQRLKAAGLVREVRDPGNGQYRRHEITEAGKARLRRDEQEESDVRVR